MLDKINIVIPKQTKNRRNYLFNVIVFEKNPDVTVAGNSREYKHVICRHTVHSV